MKNQKQLESLIEVARALKSRGALTADASEGTGSTNSWGPQMRV